jgi:hypothetical protein
MNTHQAFLQRRKYFFLSLYYNCWHSCCKRKLYKVLVGKPEGKKPLGRWKCRWEDGIKMDLRESGWKGVERVHLAQDRDWWWAFVDTVMNLRVLAPQS